MRFRTALKILTFVLASLAIYLIAIYLAFQQGWTIDGVRQIERSLLTLGFRKDEALNLAIEVSGTLLQILTLGIVLWAGGMVFRAIDRQKKRTFVAKQVMADYRQMVRTLKKINTLSPINRPDHSFLRFLLDTLERQIQRMQVRSTQVAENVDLKAAEEYEQVVDALDNILSFIIKVRGWNEGLDKSAPRKFYIPNTILSQDGRQTTKTDIVLFEFINDRMMSFFKKVNQKPSKKERRAVVTEMKELDEIRNDFLEIYSAAAPQGKSAA